MSYPAKSTQIEKNNYYSILIVLIRAYPHEVTLNKSEKNLFKNDFMIQTKNGNVVLISTCAKVRSTQNRIFKYGKS